jgi:hypothetical protein
LSETTSVGKSVVKPLVTLLKAHTSVRKEVLENST